MYDQLPTERVDPEGPELDRLAPAEIARLILQEEERTREAVRSALDAIGALCEAAADSLRRGGRLIYVGAGTSGRLGVLDASEMGPTFGALLVQTPPWLKADLDTLRTFLDWIPEGIRVALEFRSRSWFEDRVVDTLAERGHALAAADTGNPDKDPPLAAGGGWCYARLRREDYDEAALREWASRLAALPVEDRFIFFKHEDEAAGPRIAARFAELLAEGVG